MEFYERLEQVKKTLKLTNEDLGNVVGKKADAFRLAIVKKSLKKHDIAELEMYLDRLENKSIEIKNPQQKEEGFLQIQYEKLLAQKDQLIEWALKENERMREEINLMRSNNNNK